MRKTFFKRFEPQEKAVNRSLSMPESDWSVIEAYRLYGASHTGHEIPLQKLMREIILSHIDRDRSFSAVKQQWLAKLKEAQQTQGEQQ